MRKEVVIITGYPGSGKSSLSKYLTENTSFIHVDFDLLDEMPSEKNIIFDGVHFNTEKLQMSLDYFDDLGYKITVIYVNTNKEICLKNILSRNRPTIDICDVEIHYNFEELSKEFNFNLIQIKNYKLDTENSKCNTNKSLFTNLTKVISNYENKWSCNNTENISRQPFIWN